MARPREQRVDDAVLAVALETFFEHGLDGTSLVAVARRAGVSRQSIYRRWPTRLALVLAAIDAAPVELPEVSGSTLVQRLVALLTSVDADEVARRLARSATRLSHETERHPELVERCTARFAEPRRRQLLGELRRGVDRGELRPDVDLALLADALTGTLLFRRMLPPGSRRAGPGGPETDEVTGLVTLLVDGAGPGVRAAGRRRPTNEG